MNHLLWLNKTIPVETSALKKNASLLKNVLMPVLSLQPNVVFLNPLSATPLSPAYMQPISFTSTCQQQNHQTSYMQHI